MIKSPKERFQSSQIVIGQWANLVSNPIFDEACDFALLEMQDKMPSNAEQSFQSHQQMVGATTLVRILKTIHEKTEQPKETTAKGLNYNAGV